MSDRQILVTDANGKFVTSRRYPKMVLITSEVSDKGDSITLSAPGMDTIKVPIKTGGKKINVQVE